MYANTSMYLKVSCTVTGRDTPKVTIQFFCTYTYLYLPIPTYLPTYLPTCLPAYLETCKPTYLPIYTPTYLPTYKPMYLSAYLGEDRLDVA